MTSRELCETAATSRLGDSRPADGGVAVRLFVRWTGERAGGVLSRAVHRKTLTDPQASPAVLSNKGCHARMFVHWDEFVLSPGGDED